MVAGIIQSAVSASDQWSVVSDQWSVISGQWLAWFVVPNSQ